MEYILKKSMDNVSCLIHFYETQKQYINKKSKTGMKNNQTGFLLDIYLNVLANGTDEDKKRNTFKSLEHFAKKYLEVKEIKEDTVVYVIKSDTKIDISAASTNYNNYSNMPSMHLNNTIVMLITRFEEFVADFIKYLYLKYPQKYLDNQTVCFSEISTSDLSTIKEKIIDREIDAIMRQSYSVWFDILKEHKMNLDCCKDECDFLKELYATRNVLVHNCGVVNEQYLKNAPSTQYKFGDKVKIDDTFAKKSFECIKTIMLCTMIEGIRLEKELKDDIADVVFNYGFEELSSDNYNCSKTVFNALYNSPFTNEITKQMSRVNCWIARIELNGLDDVKHEIDNFDVTALDLIFLLAKNILLCKYKDATHVLEELCESKKIASLELENWPLFKNYKRTNEYKDFKDSHPELVSVASLEIDDETSISNSETTKSVKAELNDIEES